MSVYQGLTRNRQTSLGQRVRGVAMTGTLLFSLVWSMPALAAPNALPSQQDDAPTFLNLGEMATGTLANGESVLFTFDAPEDTTYVITTGDDEEAEKFDLILTSEDGEEVYNDIFETVQFDLDDGAYTLELVAVEDAEFSVFVTAQIGDLSGAYNRPGDLIAGSFVTLDSVSGDQYATLEVPETDYWQQVFVVMSGAEGDDFSATISDESYDTYAYVSSTSTDGPLRFFSRGGIYDLSITPAQEGELTVVVLSSGPAPTIALNEDHEDTISLPSGESYFVVQPTEAGHQTTVTLSSDSENVDLELSVSETPGDDTYRSSNYGSNESITLLPQSDAPLYIRVYAYDLTTLTDPVPFTIHVEEGSLAEMLQPDVPLSGDVQAERSSVHMLSVPESNVFVTVYLVGANLSDDLDLRANVNDSEGNYYKSTSSANSGSAEVMGAFADVPTVWQIEVDGSYISDDTSYTLLARVEPVDALTSGATASATEEAPVATAEEPAEEPVEGAEGQWAIDATASSEYGDTGFSAAQATGEPNVPEASDNSNAWAPMGTDDGVETLDLTYATAVVPTAIAIYESFNPGAVISVAALDPNSNEWITLWEGESPTNETLRVFSPELTPPDFATDQIRITLDTSLVEGWNEIDAVQLIGEPAQ